MAVRKTKAGTAGQPIYVNRELALLDFQARVLEEAEDPANPLLERARFCAIFSSNLAEFYMVRVAGMKQQIEAGVEELSDDGLTPHEQLTLVRSCCRALLQRARRAYMQIVEQLDGAGIHVRDYASLGPAERAVADGYFASSVFPVLTPLAFDPGRPFPHISNLSMNLALLVRGPDGEDRFARVKVPEGLPRLIPIEAPESTEQVLARERHATFVWLEQIIAANAGTLFPGLEVVEAHPFRVTRDAEIVIQELEADDLLESIEEGVRRRRFGSVVRLTVEPGMPEFMRDILVENMRMDPEDVITLDPPLGMSQFGAIASVDRPDLRFPPFKPLNPLDSLGEDTDIFAAMRERDILLHHPYESFTPVVELIRRAADDPDVLAIKMTLYRVGANSPIVQALMDAVRAGKEVACLVELKARFDEESNIEWARALEAEGVHVVYGFVGLKTHSKVALVVRREGGGVRRYVHVGTGNYNAVTAKQYTDLGLLTTDPAIGADSSELFNLITGYASTSKFERFLVAPRDLRPGLEKLIKREIGHAREGREAHLIFKMNSLVDRRFVALLYEASQAGVKIDLLVRGTCVLKPGIAGLSETIDVRSVVGRFLEHSRIYWFANGGEPAALIGSADLMVRNLDRRIEVLCPITDPRLLKRLREEILETCMNDTVKARRMLPDGSYERVGPAEGAAPLDSQAHFLALSARRRRPRRPKKPIKAARKRYKSTSGGE
jgi:polyphosphate kinase